jgi:hypothetical protein
MLINTRSVRTDHLVFARKTTAGIAADFRATAARLGRQDVIPLFNERLASNARRLWILTAIRLLAVNDSTRVVRYLTASSRTTPKVRGRGERLLSRSKRAFSSDSARSALALDDPCAGIGNDV